MIAMNFTGGWPSRPSTRRGHTLIELAVVIAINSVLMAVAVGLLGTLLRTEQTGQRHWNEISTHARVAAQFRADVAAARRASIVPGKKSVDVGMPTAATPDVLRLEGPADRIVEFRGDGQYVRRVESRGTSIVRREAYATAALAEAVFAVPDERAADDESRGESSALVTMTLRSVTEPGFGADPWQVTARLAKDWRFAAGERSNVEDER